MSAVSVLLHDAALAARFLPSRSDAPHTVHRRLYLARRNFLPPRAVPAEGIWYFDQVHWSGPDLPSGELKRSIGHRNPQDQVEEFLWTQGAGYLLVAPDSMPTVDVFRCTTGGFVRLDGGAFHLSAVSSRSATVENRYIGSGAVDERDNAKYETATETPAADLHFVRGDRAAVYLLNSSALTVVVRILLAPTQPAGSNGIGDRSDDWPTTPAVHVGIVDLPPGEVTLLP